MRKRMNLYGISGLLDVIYHDGIVDLPAIDIVNKTIDVLGYKGKFGLDESGRPAFQQKEGE